VISSSGGGTADTESSTSGACFSLVSVSVDGGDDGGVCQPNQGAKAPCPHRDGSGGDDDKPPIICGLAYRLSYLISKTAEERHDAIKVLIDGDVKAG